MSWPLSHDFNEAVQTPQLAFQDPDLKGGETVVGATGLPLPRSGNFADVYQVRGADGREWAVKCFTRPVVGLAERYAKIGETLTAANLPFTVGFTYLADGIRVGGAWRPIVKMEWVEGLLLNQVVRDNAGSVKVLTALGGMWAKLCKRLREANVAHADVQHGNVLLVPGSRPGAYGLKLIDYDGMWVKALANTPSGESGHPSYQHPGRAAARGYSPDVDRFPHLAVATALRGLIAGGPKLWEKYDNGDNLLFTEADFKKPADSKLMRELWQQADPAVQSLVGRLAVACDKPIPQTPWLDQVAPDGEPAPLDFDQRREAEAALGIAAPVAVGAGWAPLPPEPGAAVEAKVAPKPLPPAPAPKPKPARPVAVEVVEDEEDESPFATKSRKVEVRARRPKPKKGPPVAALVGAGALGVVLVVVLVIAFRPKPEPVAQSKADPEPTEPVKQPAVTPKPPTVPPPKPKDVAEPKPKEKEPDKKEPDKKEPPEPPKPKPPAVLAPKWSVAVDTDGAPATLQVRDGSVLYGGPRTSLVALDLGSGSKRPAFGQIELTGGDAFAPLDGGRVAKYAPDDTEVRTWDAKTGRPGDRYPVPAIPPGTDAVKLKLAWLSPNSRYLAVARGSGKATPHAGVPLAVFTTDKMNRLGKAGEALVDVTWTGGTVHFAGDSSRVLAAEYNGRFRWFDLVGDDPSSGWNFPAEATVHLVTDVSASGSVLGYNGTARGDDGTDAVPHVLDGRTGKVLLRFGGGYLAASPVSLSASGQLAAVLKEPADGAYTVEVVAVPKGDVVARATVTSEVPPPFALSDDGRVLIVHLPKAGKLERFDLP